MQVMQDAMPGTCSGSQNYFLCAVAGTVQPPASLSAGGPGSAVAPGDPWRALGGAVYRLTFAALYSKVYKAYTVGASNRTGGVFCFNTDTMHFLVTGATRTYAAFPLEDATPLVPWHISADARAPAGSRLLERRPHGCAPPW